MREHHLHPLVSSPHARMQDTQAEFKENQNLVAAMVHLAKHEHPDEHFRLLNHCEKTQSCPPRQGNFFLDPLSVIPFSLCRSSYHLEQIRISVGWVAMNGIELLL